MSQKRSFLQKLVIWTAVCTSFGIIGIVSLGIKKPEPVLYPGISVTLGHVEAAVELLVVEDLLCERCRFFHTQIFPQIEHQWIQSGQMRYTLVPIAHSLNSQKLANAALAIRRIQPPLFWPYLGEILNVFPLPLHQAIHNEELLAIARRVGLADLTPFVQCIDSHCNRDLLDQNLLWAKRKMGENFTLPAVYLNGERVFVNSFEDIEQRLELVQK